MIAELILGTSPEFLTGFIMELTGDDHGTEIASCLVNGKDLEGEIVNALELLSTKDMPPFSISKFQGLQAMLAIVSKFAADFPPAACPGMK